MNSKFIIFAIIILMILGLAYLFLNSKNLKTKVEQLPLGQINSNTSQEIGDSQLKNVCQKAVADYSDDVISKDALVVWENNDKGFYYRKGPKAMSVTLNNIAVGSQQLEKLILVDKDNVGYLLNSSGKSIVGVFNLNNNSDKQVIFEADNQSIKNIAFIDKNTAIIALEQDGKTLVSVIKDKNKTVLGEISGLVLKLSLSPRKDYLYVNQKNGNTAIFNLQTRKEIDKINKADELTWLGNGFILYRDGNSIFLYDMEKKTSSKIGNLGQAQGIAFHPEQGGLFGFSKNGEVQVVSCQNGKTINSNSEGLSIVFTNDETAFVRFKNKESGYWEFSGKSWIVKLSDKLSLFLDQPVMATFWNKY